MKAIMRDAAELKDSGIEWIGDIPYDWNISRIGNFFCFRSGDTLTNEQIKDEEKYPVYGANGCRGYYDQYNLNGKYILLGRVGALCGNVHIVNESVWVTEHALIAEMKKEITHEVYAYIFASMNLIQYSKASAQPVISSSTLMGLRIPIIPKKEQQLIANYLDDRCSKIDAIIAEAKASIEEYKELKQAVITQAVTLGKKKNRPLKDTNILWIGKTPFEWQVAELKFFASIKSGITLGQKYPAGAKLVEMPYLRVANVQGEYVDLSDVKTIQVLPEEVDKYRLEAGVVLMTEGGDRDKLGRGCVWHGEITPCLHQNHIFALTTKSDKLLPEYFSHVTTSEVARCYFDYTAKKTTNLANTNSSTIMNFRLSIPPLEEQREIVQYLDKRIKTLNDMISEKQSLIEDLESYKKSLIYEVVTGKRKVVE